MKRNKLFQALLMTGVLLLTGCGESEKPVEPSSPVTPEVVKPTSISIESTATKLEVGKTLQLTAKVTPEGADASVTWSSSSNEVATVSESGLVTGVKAGDVIIKATSKVDTGVYKEIALTVDPEVLPNAESIEITAEGGKKEVATAGSLQLTAKVSPAKADQAVSWSSSDSSLAIVNANGLVKGVKEGEVTITATAKKAPTVKATIKLTVVKGEAPEPTTDWSKVEFSNHDKYVNELKKGNQIKVKGTVTHVREDKDKNDTPIYRYFLQNGKEGFYISSQPIVVGEIKLGKSYEIGGIKDYTFNCNSIKAVEYVKPLEETLPVEEIDITNEESYVFNDQKKNMGAKVVLNNVEVDTLPGDFSKAFSLKVASGKNKINLRVDPKTMSEETFKAVAKKASELLPHQPISVKGFMNSFGYGKPESQIDIFDAESIIVKELNDKDKVTLVTKAFVAPTTLTTETKIELPTAMENIEGVKLTWESNNPAINVETGAVTHGKYDTEVELTMIATCGTETAKAKYTVNVISANDDYYTEVARLDFEDADPKKSYGNSVTKPGYRVGNVNLGGHNWEMNSALIGGDERDRREGVFGARVQTQYENGLTLLDKDLKFDTLEFLVGIYGENLLGPEIQISYAIDDSEEFTVLPRTFIINHYELRKVRVTLPIEGDHTVRVRIGAVVGTGQRFNVDNIRLLQKKVDA